MKKSFSIYLDAVGFLAVMTVIAAHFVTPRWTGGAVPERIAVFLRGSADDAVMALFVLAGFVIAYSARAKDRGWRDFAVTQASRIYCVIIPALFFVFFLEALGKAQNPAAYDGWWYADHPLWAIVFRGLTFSNELWMSAFRMGSNGPYWALGYGIWYIVLFSAVFFTGGKLRNVLVAAIALLVGPKIWLLAPVWMLGVLFCEVVRRGWLRDHEGPTALTKELVAVVAPVMIYFILRYFNVNVYFDAAAAGMIGLFYEGDLGHAHGFLWKWFVGGLVLVHLFGVALLLQRLSAEIFASADRPVRWFAGASFTLYILHYPLLQFFDVMMWGAASDPLRAFCLFVLAIGVSFLFAEISERRLRLMRLSLKRGQTALRRRLNPMADDAPIMYGGDGAKAPSPGFQSAGRRSA